MGHEATLRTKVTTLWKIPKQLVTKAQGHLIEIAADILDNVPGAWCAYKWWSRLCMGFRPPAHRGGLSKLNFARAKMELWSRGGYEALLNDYFFYVRPRPANITSAHKFRRATNMLYRGSVSKSLRTLQQAGTQCDETAEAKLHSLFPDPPEAFLPGQQVEIRGHGDVILPNVSVKDARKTLQDFPNATAAGMGGFRGGYYKQIFGPPAKANDPRGPLVRFFIHTAAYCPGNEECYDLVNVGELLATNKLQKDGPVANIPRPRHSWGPHLEGPQ